MFTYSKAVAREFECDVLVIGGGPAGFGAAVITEDSLSHHMQKEPVGVLNQWTYHSRLYASARYITTQKDMNLVQLVSFGCGVDAITTDEVREILEDNGKIYTQIKIDEITNLGAVKIVLGWKRFLLYILFSMAFAWGTGMIVNALA